MQCPAQSPDSFKTRQVLIESVYNRGAFAWNPGLTRAKARHGKLAPDQPLKHTMSETQTLNTATPNGLKHNFFKRPWGLWIAQGTMVVFCLALVVGYVRLRSWANEWEQTHAMHAAVRVTGLEGTRLYFDTERGEMATDILRASGLPKTHAGQIFSVRYFPPKNRLTICAEAGDPWVCYDLDAQQVPKLVAMALKEETIGDENARKDKERAKNERLTRVKQYETFP